MIKVYHFKIWDGEAGENKVPPRKRTAEQIKEMGSDPIWETEEEIDPSQLDEYDRYDPRQSEADHADRT